MNWRVEQEVIEKAKLEISGVAHEAIQVVRNLGYELNRPSVLLRLEPKRSVNGKGDAIWTVKYGDVSATGSTPAQAISNFDYYAWHGKPQPE